MLFRSRYQALAEETAPRPTSEADKLVMRELVRRIRESVREQDARASAASAPQPRPPDEAPVALEPPAGDAEAAALDPPAAPVPASPPAANRPAEPSPAGGPAAPPPPPAQHAFFCFTGR